MGVRVDRAPTWTAGTPTKLLESHYFLISEPRFNNTMSHPMVTGF